MVHGTLLLARLLRDDRRGHRGGLRARPRGLRRRPERLPVPGLSVPDDGREPRQAPPRPEHALLEEPEGRLRHFRGDQARDRRSRSAAAATPSTPSARAARPTRRSRRRWPRRTPTTGSEVAELVAKGMPAVRLVYADGGQHESFRNGFAAARRRCRLRHPGRAAAPQPRRREPARRLGSGPAGDPHGRAGPEPARRDPRPSRAVRTDGPAPSGPRRRERDGCGRRRRPGCNVLSPPPAPPPTSPSTSACSGACSPARRPRPSRRRRSWWTPRLRRRPAAPPRRQSAVTPARVTPKAAPTLPPQRQVDAGSPTRTAALVR